MSENTPKQRNKMNNNIPAAANNADAGKALADASKEGTKKAGEKAGAEAAKKAASAGSAASTGGLSKAAEAGVEAGKTIGKLGDTEDDSGNLNNSNLAIILIAAAFVFIIAFTLIAGSVHYYMPSPVESYIENQYLEVEADNGSDTSWVGWFEMLFRRVAEFFGYEYKTPSRYEVVYEDSLNTDVDIIKKGLTKAFEEVAPREVKSVIREKKYDYDLTWESWEKNENPYLTDGEWNVNFAEFMVILNEAESLAINDFEPAAYQEFMEEPENLKYLYYLEFAEKWRYIETYEEMVEKQATEYGEPVFDENGEPVMESVPGERTATWDVPAGQTTLTTPRGSYSLNENNTTLWAEVTLYKYDLLDLCDMVAVDLYGTNQYGYRSTNMEMYLPVEESYSQYLMYEDNMSYPEFMLRSYAKDIDLGPTEKTPIARHHHNGLDDEEYGPGEDGQVPEFDPEDDASVSDAIKYLIEWMHSKVGNPYSQADRNDGYHFDCSSLVYYAYKQIGIDVGHGYAPTAADMARIMDNAKKSVPASNLQPGDIVFYSHEYNGRYKNITHVGIYIGNGMMIDARGKKYGVVLRQMPTKNIVDVARPTL